jgi:hypothetical protein
MLLSEILERVLARSEQKSIRGASRRVGIDPASWIDYRDHGTLPSDETMVRLCLAGDVDPEEGLLLLNVWRSKGRARTMYSRLVKMWRKERKTTASNGGDETLAEQILI